MLFAVLRAQSSAEQSRSILPEQHQVSYATKQSLAGFEKNPPADSSHRLDSLHTVSVIWSSQLNVAQSLLNTCSVCIRTHVVQISKVPSNAVSNTAKLCALNTEDTKSLDYAWCIRLSQERSKERLAPLTVLMTPSSVSLE